MTPARTVGWIVVVAVLATLAAVGACGPGGGAGAGGGGAALAAKPREYRFRWVGDEADLPWNRTLFVSLYGADGTLQPPLGLLYFEDTPEVKVTGIPGTAWFARSEREPTFTTDRVLWMLKQKGVFDERDVIDLKLPPRTRIRLTGDESTSPGADYLTVAEPHGHARLTAVRSALTGLRIGIWDASKPASGDEFQFAEHTAPTRPWVCKEIKPGRFVVGARCDGRQWIVRTMDLKAGEEAEFDVTGAPEGGGSVVCENARAELLVGGELPLPPLRTVRDFYRARWDGVPPGRHAMRYPDGKRVDVDVADGKEIVLPREPR